MTDRETVNGLADRALVLYRAKKDSRDPADRLSLAGAVWATLRKRWPRDRAAQERYFDAVMGRMRELSEMKRVVEARRAPRPPKERGQAPPERRPPEQLEFPATAGQERAKGNPTEYYMGHPDVPLGPKKR